MQYVIRLVTRCFREDFACFFLKGFFLANANIFRSQVGASSQAPEVPEAGVLMVGGRSTGPSIFFFWGGRGVANF